MKPRVESLFRKQTSLCAALVKDAEQLLQSGESKDSEKAGVYLLRASRGFPKNKALAKLFAEPEYKKLMQQTELEFLRENAKRMPEIDEELYFAIDEKMNQIDLTEKGREELAIGFQRRERIFCYT